MVPRTKDDDDQNKHKQSLVVVRRSPKLSNSILLIIFTMTSLSYLVALLSSLVFVGAHSAGNGTYTNPVLNAVGADPYVAEIICRFVEQIR